MNKKEAKEAEELVSAFKDYVSYFVWDKKLNFRAKSK
jgi:hypothetical protein